MSLLTRLRRWRARRRHAAHRRFLRKHHVMVLPKPDPHCIVHNTREPL